jgi:arginase
MALSQVSLLGVPTSAGTHGPGLEKAPAHVRAARLVDRLKAAGVAVDDLGDLTEVRFRADPSSRTAQSLPRVVEVATEVATRVEDIVRGGGFPFVLGGDCTITLGVVAGFLRAGKDIGLFYFDGDIDLSTPQRTVSGILDAMGMAHLLGEGDPALSRLGPRYPLMKPDRVIAFGYDLIEVDKAARAAQRRLGLVGVPADDIVDPDEQAREAWDTLAARAEDGVLLHFDVDVIDSTDLPLADFPHFNQGLSWPAAGECLRVFGAQETLAGVVLTEINPNRDPDGVLIDTLLDTLVAALTS